jgi:hypothetical protein
MAPANVADVLPMLTQINMEEMMAGLPVDWTKVIDKETVLRMAVHCAINGPVGIGKLTTFPTLSGEMSIRSKLNQQASNSGWRSLVRVVAEAINSIKPGLDCNHRRIHGDLWPIKGK